MPQMEHGLTERSAAFVPCGDSLGLSPTGNIMGPPGRRQPARRLANVSAASGGKDYAAPTRHGSKALFHFQPGKGAKPARGLERAFLLSVLAVPGRCRPRRQGVGSAGAKER